MNASANWRGSLGALIVFSVFSLTLPAFAQEPDCAECHEAQPAAMAASVHAELVCADCHTEVPPEHDEGGMEPLDDSACGSCHRRPNREVGRSIHGDNAVCTDCHGAAHEILTATDLASAMSPVNQIRYCGACHDEPASLVDGYLTSVHGKALLLSGLIDAPSCSDCHGAHAMIEADDDDAQTSHFHSPEVCGSCHLLLFEEWKTESAHGIHWQAGEEGPVCTDCHASHEIADPTLSAARLASAANCGGCHEEYLTTFRDSFHGKANDLGFVSGATCADCHTPHRNLAANDPRSSVHPDNLVQTCGACHEGISASMLSFDPHNDPSDPEDNFYVYVIWIFMTGLLIGVFSFFGLHDLLWLQRTLVGAIRGEFAEQARQNGQYIRRFSRVDIRLHITIVVTFLLLALTGLPLKFHDAGWAQALMTLLGGIDASRFIHRVAAIGTFGYAIFHLGSLFVRWAVRRERGLFWGPNSMVPQPKDVMDVLANFRYFVYLGKRPESDRWNYIEKFDYLAVFWGVMIIGVSGLMLWLPMFFTSFLPGWAINAAYVIHSDEALLATGFIFVFHFFHTHLRPESFPMDVVIFTGKMSLERFKEERPIEYRRLVENNELEEYLVEAPSMEERRRAYIWGTIFLTVGVMLAVGIIWALLTH